MNTHKGTSLPYVDDRNRGIARAHRGGVNTHKRGARAYTVREENYKRRPLVRAA